MRRIERAGCAFVASACALAATASAGRAQSFNIDFGPASSAPAASYGAVGSPGVWNAFNDLPTGVRFPLVDLAGHPTAARIYNIGGISILSSNDPATTGNDEALLDDMLIGFNDPVDVCLFFEGFANGDYMLVTYAMTPNDPALQSRVRVDLGSPGPVMVGGAWPGAHVEGVTFARHTLTVTDGTIGLHSGLWEGLVQSGVNGLQIIRQTGVGVADPIGGIPRILRIAPNPAGGAQLLDVLAPMAGTLEVFDASGRRVWEHALAGSPEAVRVLWDGRDTAGRLVPPGVYFVRVPGAGSDAPARLLRVR